MQLYAADDDPKRIRYYSNAVPVNLSQKFKYVYAEHIYLEQWKQRVRDWLLPASYCKYAIDQNL